MHAANSAATLRDPATHFDMVRRGVAIYGMDPFGEDPFARGLEPALTLRPTLPAVKDAAPGRERRLRPALRRARADPARVLPIGYGDGWRRGLTNNADVLIGGRRFPLVGTVSMDNITVDLGPTAASPSATRRVLIGAQGPERILAEEVARRLDTINYEVTCAPRACRGAPPRRVSAGVRGLAREALRGRHARPGSSAARCATGCSAGRCSTSTSPSPATRGALARALARVAGGPVFQLSGEFGAWRVVARPAARGRST